MLTLTSCQKELFYTSFIAAAVLGFAYYKNFFGLPAVQKSSLNLKKTLAAFAIFFGGHLFFALLLTLLFNVGKLPELGYVSLCSFGAATGLLLWYINSSSLAVKKDIVGVSGGYRRGILSWCVAYPTGLFFGQVAACFMEGVFHYSDPSQYIVEQLLALRAYPFLFTLTAFSIVFIVPAVEELLFRGFLHNYLKNRLPRPAAIVLTALLFTAAHFSSAQGLGNVEILTTLFVISLFLSHIYEKWGSILAPIALHQTFNLISFIGLLF